MTQKKPTLHEALHTPLEVISREHVDGNPSGLEMIRLLRARIQELEEAVEATLRHEQASR